MKRIVLGVAILFMLGWMIREWTQGERSAAHLPRTCTFVKGAHKRYDVAYRSIVTFDPSIQAKKSRIVLSAQMDFRVLDRNQSTVLLSLTLSHIQLDLGNPILENALTRLYQSNVIIAASPDGHFRHYYYPGIPKDFKGLLTLYAMLQYVCKPDDTYESTGTSPLGTCLARYRWHHGVLHKSRLRYLTMVQPEQDYHILHSEYRIAVTRESPWIDRIDADETVEVSHQGAPIFRTETTLRITPLQHVKSVATTQAQEKPRRSVQDTLRRYQRMMQHPASKSIWKQIETLSQKTYFEQHGITSDSLIAAMEESRTFQNDFTLKHYLQLYPEEMVKVSEIIQKNRGSSLSGRLIHVLEMVGTPQATDILSQIVQEDEAPLIDRERAVIAMGGIKRPTDAMVNTLRDLSLSEDKDEDSSRLSNDAVYALASLSTRTDTDTKNNIQHTLRDWISSGEDAARRSTAFQAAIESDPVAFRDTILTYIESNDPKLQLLAIDGAGRLDDPEAKEKLIEIVTNPSSLERVRNASFVALMHQGTANERAVSEAKKILDTQTSRSTRRAAVDYLCRTLSAFPENSTLLRTRLSTEHDPYIIKQIIRSIHKSVQH